MGISLKTYKLLQNTLNLNYTCLKNLDLLELGIQESIEHGMGFHYLQDNEKNKFKSYISLDLHQNDKVTIFDLSEFRPNAFNVDIITNFGTSEHVEFEEGQYNCWKNMHHWLKLNGILIHLIPEIGSWKGHCRYYTDERFFQNFEKYGYQIKELFHYENHNGKMNWCVMKKINNIPFMEQETFYDYMHKDITVSLEEINPLNNPKNLKI